MNFVTKKEVVKAFKNLGIASGDLLLVYGLLPQTDEIIGSSQTIIEALFEAVDYQATIVMPAHSLHQKQPTFFDEAASEEKLQVLKQEMPAFDPHVSPILSGELAATLILDRNVVRSDHPIASFIALGQKAKWLMINHQLNSMFGYESPLQKLYAQGAKILCLGADYQTITALHLSEYFAGNHSLVTHEAVIMKNGERTLVQFEDLALDSTIYNEIGREYEKSKQVSKTMIGTLECRLLDYQDIVDFSAAILSK